MVRGVRKLLDRFARWYYASPLHYGPVLLGVYVTGLMIGKAAQ